MPAAPKSRLRRRRLSCSSGAGGRRPAGARYRCGAFPSGPGCTIVGFCARQAAPAVMLLRRRLSVPPGGVESSAFARAPAGALRAEDLPIRRAAAWRREGPACQCGRYGRPVTRRSRRLGAVHAPRRAGRKTGPAAGAAGVLLFGGGQDNAPFKRKPQIWPVEAPKTRCYALRVYLVARRPASAF